MSKLAIVSVLTAFLPVTAYAHVAVDFPLVDNSASPELTGYVTQDIRVYTGWDWTSAGMILNLTSGSLYQYSDGEHNYDSAPSSSVMDLYPEIAFDTFVGVVDVGVGFIAGEAGDLGSTASSSNYQLDTLGADVTWADMDPFEGPGLNTIGRLSLSDDAQGTFAFSVTQANSQLVSYEFSIVDGQVVTDPCAGLGGDASCGGEMIGIEHLNQVLSHWNENVPSGDRLMGDYIADGFVGIEDLNFILSYWNDFTVRFPPAYQVVGYHPDYDGFVGITELNLILSQWNAPVPVSLQNVDYNGDGYVGQDDLNYVLMNWNAGTPPMAVPEPVSGALLLFAAPILLRRHGNRSIG